MKPQSADGPRGFRGGATAVFLFPLRVYRRVISPLFPPCCKYCPTCSTYALRAIQRFGPIRGGWLAAWRLLRCNPWSNGGFDPVPKKFDFLGRHPEPPVPGNWEDDLSDEPAAR